MDKNFSQFTNLYSLSKTLRFELKPSEKKVFKGGDIVKLQKSFKEIQKNF